MKKNLLLVIFIITLAILAGVFSTVAYAQGLEPWNVILEVDYNGDTVTYDLSQQIATCSDSAESRAFYFGSKGKREAFKSLLSAGAPYNAVCEYILPNFMQVVKHFSYVEREKVDSVVIFGKSGFNYSKPVNGVAIDVQKLVDTALNSGGKKIKTTLPLIIDKAVTENELKVNTVLKGKFTTTFYNSGENRCHNISVAANALNGTVVQPNETFSFNNAVGERTEKNGYKTSKIILDGNYTDGVGGGVCQVSTTLYNALLLSEFVPRATQHSLVSAYVMTGFDAMVSYGSADLTFTNTTSHPIYIGASVSDKTLTFWVYGEPNEYQVVRENVEERTPFDTITICDETKYPDLIYDDQYKIIQSGSDGVKSKSYLLYYQNGILVEKRLIRSNVYKKVDKIVAVGKLPRPTEQDALPDAADISRINSLLRPFLHSAAAYGGN